MTGEKGNEKRFWVLGSGFGVLGSEFGVRGFHSTFDVGRAMFDVHLFMGPGFWVRG